MAEFFQTVHLREEFFPLINPRVAAVRVHKQVVYTCNIHSWDWRAPGSAAELRGAGPGLESVTCCLCGWSAALQTPALRARWPLGPRWQGSGRKHLPVKYSQNQSEVAGGGHPRREPGVTFSPLKTTGKLLKVHFYCVPKPNRKQEGKKKSNLPRPATILHFERPFIFWFFL